MRQVEVTVKVFDQNTSRWSENCKQMDVELPYENVDTVKAAVGIMAENLLVICDNKFNEVVKQPPEQSDEEPF